ncbi:hypothetical protein LCGC14_0087160 [marine sediment metagenome]|uniref:Uncharacterized protein n=1 Tax=marine sediment metagenome TaxID=412755 RepID=A0A0F9VWK6_9ZZZZ|nr:hypothetical protein [Halomonas sp.]HDZ46412.1 hypothetical protein [Halomonas sp.]HEB06214.1 hypothetical protein [Halomonas sp.]
MARPFKWIDVEDPEQFNWIANYLVRQSTAGLLPNALTTALNRYSVEETVYRLEEMLDTAVFRELSRRMQATWNVRQHRKKHGNPVSIQMSKEAQKQLKALAKKSGQTQVETLGQIISNAVHEQKQDMEKYKKEKESFFLRIEKHRRATQQVKYVYGGVVESLLKSLAEEINHRCRYEALVGKLDDAAIENEAIEAYCDSVTKRVAEVERELSKLKLMRARVGPSLNERMQEFIRFHEEEGLDVGSDHS